MNAYLSANVAANSSSDENKCLKILDEIQAVSFNGQDYTELTRRHYLNDLLLTVRKGDTVYLKILREGVEKTVSILFDKDEFFTKYE